MSSSIKYNPRSKRSASSDQQSQTTAHKRPKATLASEDDDAVPPTFDETCSSDNDIDINDAADEECEPLKVQSDDSNSSVQSQTATVFNTLGLERFPDHISFLETLLDSSTIYDDTRLALKRFRATCLSDAARGHLGRSTEPTDAFLTRSVPGWACNDDVITELWDDLVEKLVALGVVREDLVKPSGPIGAILAILWHYPTYNSSHAEYGNVADPSNFSLAAQYRKAGPSESILTVDRHPMRHIYTERGVDWEKDYPDRWEEIEDLVKAFVKTVLSFSKVLIFVGQENARTWKNLVNLAPGDRWGVASILNSKQGLKIPSTVFGSLPSLFMLKNREGEIKKLVFVSYHSQHFMHTTNLAAGAYTDLLWNAALDICGLDIKQADTFIEMIGQKAKPKSWWACFYVDPVTGKKCYEVRGNVKTLKRHWDCHHSKTPGAIWDSTKATNVDYPETPAELRINEWRVPAYKKKWKRNEERWQTIQDREAREALAMQSVARSNKDLERLEKQQARLKAEKERLSGLSKDDLTSKGTQRKGRKPTDLDQRRARCPYIDPETGEQCCVTYSTLESLKHMHFKTKHPKATFDIDLVKWVTESEMEWQNSTMTTPETVTAREALGALSVNARSAKAKEKAKALYIFVCQVAGCSYTNACHASNFKNHVLKEHPHLDYSPDLKRKVLKEEYTP